MNTVGEKKQQSEGEMIINLVNAVTDSQFSSQHLVPRQFGSCWHCMLSYSPFLDLFLRFVWLIFHHLPLLNKHRKTSIMRGQKKKKKKGNSVFESLLVCLHVYPHLFLTRLLTEVPQTINTSTAHVLLIKYIYVSLTQV